MAPLSISIMEYVPFGKADIKKREEMKAFIAAKELLRSSQEAEKLAMETVSKASARARALEKEAKEARLAEKLAMETLEKAKLNTSNALKLVREESVKLNDKKTKKVE